MNTGFKVLFSLTVALLCFLFSFLFLSGCAQQSEEIDPDSVTAVDLYVEKLAAALLDAEIDLRGWVREPSSINLPLKYDQERIAWLADHRKNIEAIMALRGAESFPEESEISRWEVIIVRGENEWLLEGPAVVGALAKLDSLSAEVLDMIRLIENNEGELSLEESTALLTLVDEIRVKVEASRAVFYK